MTKNELGDVIIASTDTLYRVAKTILHSDADCEDAVSEMVVKSFNKIDTLREERYAKTWLIRILINECYKIINQQKRMTAADEIPEQVSEPETDYSELYQMMMQMDEKYRVPVELYYLEGYTIKEIAKILDIPENTIKSQLVRGRTQLKALYEREAI